MALPTTISGFGTVAQPVGPFQTNNWGLGFNGTPAAGNLFGQALTPSTFDRAGQNFSVPSSAQATQLFSWFTFYLYKSGSPTDSVVCDIYATSGGLPTGASLGTSTNSIPASSIPSGGFASATTFTFNFNPIALTTGGTYAFVLSRTGSLDTSNCFGIGLLSVGTSGVIENSTGWSTTTSAACNAGGTRYFIIGAPGTGGTVLAQIADDPTNSFASSTSWGPIGTNSISNLAGYQVGDLVHVLVSAVNGVTSTTVAYALFDMTTNQWTVQGEVILANANTSTSLSGSATNVSLVVRSTGEVVAFFHGTHLASMGSSWSRVYYARRTGTNTWTAPIEVDAGGLADWGFPTAILGASDSVHFLWGNFTTAATAINQRTLSSSNVLQTAGATTANYGGRPINGVSFVNGGVTKVDAVSIYMGTSPVGPKVIRFDSGNTPTLNETLIVSGAVTYFPVRLFVDGTTLYALWVNSTDNDLYVASSTDNGATWSAATNVFTGTVSGGQDVNLSVNGNVYTRGSAVVIPYVVNDNGTLKYNEYTVRTLSTPASVSESGSASDAESVTAAFVASDAESGTAADAINGTAVFNVSISESGTLIDSDLAGLLLAVSVTESGSASDVESASRGQSASTTEAGSASDSTSTAAAFVSSGVEVGTAADTPSATQRTSSSIAESGTSTDAPSATQGTSSSVIEAGTATDTTAGGLLTSVSTTESGTAADAPSASRGQSASDTEAGTATDAPSATQGTSSSVTEAGTGADATSVSLHTSSSTAEAGSSSDAVSASRGQSASATDSGTASDADSVILAAVASVSEVGTGADATDASQSGSTSSVGESGAAADVESATLATSASVVEAGTGTDAQSATRSTSSSVTEAGSATDATSASYGASGSIAEAGTAADTLSATQKTSAAVSEAGSAVDTSVTGLSGIVSEAGSASDVSSATAALHDSVSESGTAADASNGAWSTSASASEAGTATDVTSSVQSTQSSVAEAGAAVDAPTGSWNTFSSTSDSATTQDASSVSASTSVSSSDTLAAIDASTSIRIQNAEADEVLNSQDATAAQMAAQAFVGESVTVIDTAEIASSNFTVQIIENGALIDVVLVEAPPSKMITRITSSFAPTTIAASAALSKLYASIANTTISISH